jgi:hypothetical protein
LNGAPPNTNQWQLVHGLSLAEEAEPEVHLMDFSREAGSFVLISASRVRTQFVIGDRDITEAESSVQNGLATI